MRSKLFALLLFTLSSFVTITVSAKTPISEILGSWYFEGPQSTEWGSQFKEMTLNFNELGQSELVLWTRDGEGVCRRTAHFWYDENTRTLHQTTIHLDRFSPAECTDLAEMNVGTETRHQISIQGDRMILRNEISSGKPEISEWTFAFP